MYVCVEVSQPQVMHLHCTNTASQFTDHAVAIQCVVWENDQEQGQIIKMNYTATKRMPTIAFCKSIESNYHKVKVNKIR